MKRILIFSLAYYPRHVGGAEVAVKEITDRVALQDASFDMITLNGGGEAATERIGNITIHRVGSSFGMLQKVRYPFAAYKKARQLHAEKPYDVAWSIMASYGGYAGQLFKKAFPAVRSVLTIQEGDNFGRREGILYPLFSKIFVRADSIQAISRYLSDWSIRMGATGEIRIVPNGVDCDAFSKPLSPERRYELRQSLGFDQTDAVMVTASRLVYKNAIDEIIRSLGELEPNYKLLILGTGPDEAKLRALALSLKVSSRVVFKGFVPHSELPAYLQASDIFVRPSRTEGLGNSFLEAMAAGIPVIATPVGGIPDFLTDGETGLLCEVDNPRSIAQKAAKLTRDRESRDYIVRAARDMVRQKYEWSIVAAAMKDILCQ